MDVGIILGAMAPPRSPGAYAPVWKKGADAFADRGRRRRSPARYGARLRLWLSSIGAYFSGIVVR